MPSADDFGRYQPRANESGDWMPVRGAVVWYTDGTKLECTAETWPDLPSEGVVLVQVLYDYVRKNGKYLQDVLHRFDYYWERDGYFFVGRGYQVSRGTPKHKLKDGAAVSDETFTRMYNEAQAGVKV